MPSDRFYEPRPGDTPGNKTLDEVGMDFDGDLGGLKKHVSYRRSRLHPAWLLLLLVPFLLLLWEAPAYVFMLIAGAAIGAVGVLMLDTRPGSRPR